MPRFAEIAAKIDIIPIRRQRMPQRFFRIERRAVLVEISQLRFFTAVNKALIGLQLADEQLQERRFPRTIPAENTDAITLLDLHRKIVENGDFLALAHEALAHMLELGDDFTARRRRQRIMLDLLYFIRIGCFIGADFIAQLVQLIHPPLVAFAPRSDATLRPVELGLELLVEVLQRARLLLEQRTGPVIEPAIARRANTHPALLKPEHRAGKIAQKSAVVADANNRTTAAR